MDDLQEGSAVPRPEVEVGAALAELASIPLWEMPLAACLRRVADIAQRSLPAADEVSVTVVNQDGPATVAFTGDLAVALDERQYDQGTGPCLDAAMGGGVVMLPDVEHETRYPEFVRAARRAGLTATASVGLPVPTGAAGGLNVYSRQRDERGRPLLDDRVLPLCEAFAGYAAVAVGNAAMLHSTARLAEQMREAMATRATIEQAKGVIVARTGCSPEEAFQVLSRRSQASNRKLRELAAEVVAAARTSRPD